MQIWLIGTIGVIVLLLFIWWMVHSVNKLNLPKSGERKSINNLSIKQLKKYR